EFILVVAGEYEYITEDQQTGITNQGQISATKDDWTADRAMVNVLSGRPGCDGWSRIRPRAIFRHWTTNIRLYMSTVKYGD
ncbi:MAG: hypothetical protein OSB73_02535, partial [Candidatus Latescibacteria bacterium]|nr:hypothetical protein [Candidatus Latescibacterota bacterium]